MFLITVVSGVAYTLHPRLWRVTHLHVSNSVGGSLSPNSKSSTALWGEKNISSPLSFNHHILLQLVLKFRVKWMNLNTENKKEDRLIAYTKGI